MDELEAVTNQWVRRLQEQTAEEAPKSGVLTAIRSRFDGGLRTDAVEMMDRDDVGDRAKARDMATLHAINKGLGTYQACLAVLESHIRGIAFDHGRNARVLELASGEGAFAVSLARAAQTRGLPVDVTGSDINLAYVAAANRRAAKAGVTVTFRQLNAFDLSSVDGDFDLVFISQSLHHFSPGQVAKLVAQARRVARYAFIGFDGRRGLTTLLGLVGLGLTAGAIARSPHFVYDSIVSGRKFYSEADLEVMARIAAPDALITLHTVLSRGVIPVWTVLKVQ